MEKTNSLTIFENFKIRRIYDEQKARWNFSVIDIIQALIQQADYQSARKYWNKLKERLNREGNESVTYCHQLKFEAADGKFYLTDAADVETILRLIQSVPSPKAEPIKLWLARVGYERMQEIVDPAKALNRSREYWQKQGRSAQWIQRRMMGQETRRDLCKTPFCCNFQISAPLGLLRSCKIETAPLLILADKLRRIFDFSL